jgi:hypothetical protein
VVLGRLQQRRSLLGGGRRRSSAAAFSPTYSLHRSRTLQRAPSAKRGSAPALRMGPGLYTEHIAWERSNPAASRARRSLLVGKVEEEGTPDSVSYPIASWTEPSAAAKA